MGITIQLEDETGHVLELIDDPKNHLHRLLPDYDDESFHHIKYIDWYGDTVFNALQIPAFLAEWDRIVARATDDEQRELLSCVKRLATRCGDPENVHCYLRFVGD